MLSADHLISIAGLESGLTGDPDDGLSDALQSLVDTDSNFDPFVPGLRLDAPADGASANPTIRELFAIDVDFDRDGSLPDRGDLIDQVNLHPDGDIASPNDLAGLAGALQIVSQTEDALLLLDLDESGRVSLSEAFDVLIAGAATEFLENFPDTKFLDVGGFAVPFATELPDLINGFTDDFGINSSIGFVAFLEGLTEPGILDFPIDLDITVNSGGPTFAFDTDISLTLRENYLIDLGMTAESLEIDLPTETPLPGGSISPQPLATVESTFELPFLFGVGTTANSFFFAPTDDLHLTVEIDENLIGTTVNVGFLGMTAVSGSVFDLLLPFDATMTDPSSPEHLGFRDGSFATGGDGEISDSDGLLTASDPLTLDDANVLYPIIFELMIGSQGNDSPVPVEVTVPDSDYGSIAGLIAAVQGAVDGALPSLNNVITVGLAGGGEMTLSLPDTDATALGFNNQENFSAGGMLTANNQVLDFATIADGHLFQAGVLMSFGAAQPKLVSINFNVNGGTEAARRADFLTKAQAAFDAAFGLGSVVVSLDGTDRVELTSSGGESLETTRTIFMTADFNITASELERLEMENFQKLFLTSINPANDNFEISMELNAKAGLTVDNGTLDGETIDINIDLVTDDGMGGVDFAADTLARDFDFSNRERFFLGDELTLSAGFNSELFQFTSLGGAEVVNVVNQLKSWMERLPNTDMLGDFGIPFADSVLGEHLDFSDIIEDEFIRDDLDDDDTATNVDRLLIELVDPVAGSGVLVPSFATVQELRSRLSTLGLLGPGGARYDVAADKLTYDVEASETINFDLDTSFVPINFDLDLNPETSDLDPIANIAIEADVLVTGQVSLRALLGFDLSSAMKVSFDDPVTVPTDESTSLDSLNNKDDVPISTDLALTGAFDVERIFGRLTDDAHFAVSINNGAPVLVTIQANDTVDVTADNTTTQHLVSDTDAALATAGLGTQVAAEEVAGRLALKAISPSVDTLQVIVSDTALFPQLGFGQPGYTELGFRDASAATVTLVGAPVANPEGLNGTASFDIELNEGAAQNVSISLDGANTVNDLVERLNADIAGIGALNGKIIAFRSGGSIGLAAIDASVTRFEIIDDTNTDRLGLSSSDVDHQVAGVVLVGESFEDETIATPELAFGRLSGNVSFTVSTNVGAETVTVMAGDTSTNLNIGDLVDDINAELNSNGDADLDGKIVAEQAGAFQIRLRAISDDVTSIQITAGASEFGLVAGPTVTPELRHTAALFAPAYYGPSADASFTIHYNDGAPQMQAVTISADEAVDNRFFFQLVNDVNRALNSSFGGASMNPFEADFGGSDGVLANDAVGGQRLVIRATDPSITSFDIQSTAGDTAITDLKLYELDATTLDGLPPVGGQTITADRADLLIFTTDGEVHRVALDDDGTLFTNMVAPGVFVADDLDEVKAAIEGVNGTNGDVLVSLNSTETGLRLEDQTFPHGNDELFRVEAVNASRAVFPLGIHAADINALVDTQFDATVTIDATNRDGIIEGDEISPLDLEDRLFIRQVDANTDILTAGFAVFIPTEPILADFGFVGVSLTAGAFEALELGVGIGLADPNGEVTLARLFDAISRDINDDGVLNLFDLREVLEFPTLSVNPDGNPDSDRLSFDAALQAGAPGGFALGASAEIEFVLTNAGDPFNVPAGALTPFHGATDVDLNTDTITLNAHGYSNDDAVVYRAGVGETPIGGLEDGETYFVVGAGANTLQLAETAGGAPIDLTVAGTGMNHRLQGLSPIAPTVDVNWSDFGNIANFNDISFDDILAALEGLRDLLLNYASEGFLDDEIPVLGVSFNQLVGIADRFARAVDDITNNPASNVQILEQKIRESFGLPPDATVISLGLVDDNDGADGAMDDMLEIVLDLSRDFSEPLNVDLDLGFNAGAFGEIALVGNAGLGASGGVDAILTVGVDLDDDGGGDEKGEVFLFTDENKSHLNLSLNATSANLTFGASLGPLGVSIIGGDALFDLGLNFDTGVTDANARAPIGTAFDLFGFELNPNPSVLELTLPVFFPTQSDFVGDIRFAAGLTLNGTLDVNVSEFTLPSELTTDPLAFFSQFGVLSSIDLAIEALDLVLDTIQDIMSGEIFGIPLPLIDDSLVDAVEFVEDVRSEIIDPFFQLVENTKKSDQDLADLIQGYLFAILGPGLAQLPGPNDDVLDAFPELGGLAGNFGILTNGLGLLTDVSGVAATAADFANIDQFLDMEVITESPISAVEWNFNLGDTFTPNVDFPFDLGFPALGLDLQGGLAAEIFYSFGLGFGISLEDGPYINLDRRDSGDSPIPELTLLAEAGLQPGTGLEGRLGFLQFNADTPGVDNFGVTGAGANNIDDANRIFASFEVDIVEGGGGNQKLSFFELGNIEFDVDFDADADLNLDLSLGFNNDLLPAVVAGILPSLVADFVFQWDHAPINDLLDNFGAFDFAGALQLVALNGVGVDMGSFLGDFLGPIVAQIQEFTAPLQPIIDILTAPIPVVSDLAGKPIALVDIAAEFGEFDPSMIYAIADIVSFVNSIPIINDATDLILPLGDFTIVGSGIVDKATFADPTFSFADFEKDAFDTLLDGAGVIEGAVQFLDNAGNFIVGALEGASSGNAGLTGPLAGVINGDFDTGEFGFDFPFLNDPKQIFGALLGRPMVLVTYDLAPLVVEFTWEQSFMIYGPLWGVIGAGLGVRADFAFGYDTLGVQQFAAGGFENPLDLLSGFFISDTNMPDGSGADVPELQLIGEMSVGAELNAGVASAGIQAAIILTVNFDLNDPDSDGRVRIEEILGNFFYELNYGDPILAPVAIFDVSGEIAFQLRAYLKILLAKFTFEITPPITLFEFSIEFDRQPILATERGDGAVLLHMGPNAGSRLHGDTNDIAEVFNIRQDGSDIYVSAPDLGVPDSAAQKYSGDRIVGFGGEGADQLITVGEVTVPIFFEGQSGRDIIDVSMSTGGGILSGGEGDDTITGGEGPETIFGDEGHDIINGKGGNDLIFGDFGRVTTRTDGMGGGSQNFGFKETDEFYRRISVIIGEKDGNDTITGGEDADVIFGGGGRDMIGGDDDDWSVLDDTTASPGGDLIFGDGGKILFEDDGVLFAENEIRSTDGLRNEPDVIHGHSGGDTVYGGGGDDVVDGGAGDDTIFGESGFDDLSGGGDADEIHGGTEDDVIFGFRESGSDPSDGIDTIFGGSGNDFIRGNNAGDVIEGGRGADIIFGDEGDDDIIGESGPDFIFGGADSDTVDGGEGNDIIFGDDGLIVFFDFEDLGAAFVTAFQSYYERPGHIINGAGHRLIGDVPLGADPFDSSDDDDPRTLDLIVTLVQATDGNDTVIGGEADDIILGGDGNDHLFGDFDPADPPQGPIPADEDILIGDAGRIEFQNRLRDRIATVVGNTAGADELSGNGGRDVLLAGGDLTQMGGDGDKLWGRMDTSVFTAPALEEDPSVRDDDILIGDDGVVDYENGILVSIFTVFEPAMVGDPDPADTGGDDEAYGNKHNDIILGGFGGDVLRGQTDEDVIIGDNGRIDYLLEDTDAISGNDSSRIQHIFTTDPDNTTGGVDTISGDEANDIILGGAAGDEMTGGDDRDVILGDNGEVDYGDGIGEDPARPGLDFVRTLDFNVGGADTISGGGDKDIVLGGSFGDDIFGDNDLMGNPDASPDEDVLIGDQGEVEFNDDLFHPSDLVDGMSPEGVTPLPAIVRIETTDDLPTPNGGVDTIEGNEAIDVILGGVEGDILRGNEDDDIILGDEGVLTYDGTYDPDALPSMAGLADPALDTNPFSLDLISTKAPTLGGDDFIFGNENDDIALGGTGADVIIGDNDGNVMTEVFDQLEDTPGQDILIGDQGRVTLFESELSFANNITRVESTDALETDGDGDYIEGNDLADIIIGGVNGPAAANPDILHGEADLPGYVGTSGEDLIIGDEGILRFDVLPAEAIPGAGDETNATLDQIRTFKTGVTTDTINPVPIYLGGVDLIFGNGGGDVAMGGTDGDKIYGDLYANDATDDTNFVDSSTVDDTTLPPGADTLLGDGGDMRFDGFTVFQGALNADTVTILQTIEPDQGGIDTIEGNEFGDTIMGGFNGDFLFGESDDYLAVMATGGAGPDIILGDNANMSWILGNDDIANRPDVANVILDDDGVEDHDLDRITTTNPTLGGQDRIEGNGDADTILGGTDADLIWGDTPEADPVDDPSLIDPDAEADGADGADLIFGDHGKLYPDIELTGANVLTPPATFENNFFFSIDTLEADAGNGDILFGNGNDDIMIGGQGDDLMWGSDGDDDMIGGHNVALGDDDLDALGVPSMNGLDPQFLAHLNPALNKEFNDLMDGGTDDDVMAGDNAIIIRRPAEDPLGSLRFRMTGPDGTLHTLDTVSLGGIANVDIGFSANITADRQDHLDMTLVRDVYLLDHDEATQTDALDGTDRRRFGNDVMVGGLQDDEMFGQLGDDIIQGDGALSVTVDPVGLLEGYDPAQDADPSFDARDAMIDGLNTRLRFDVFENLADGNDYIEGNGGSDRAYGGLGQDDIIGGSSTLFFFPDAQDETDRPDGADLLYGGAGNPNVLVRHAEFNGAEVQLDGTDTIVPTDTRHAFDADAILGDNGEIYQIVDELGDAAVFNYEEPSPGDYNDDGYNAAKTIRVRAFNFVDYGYEYNANANGREHLDFLASARGAGDLIYGETGDDILHGMTGNDVIFGNSEDDDLYGEIGTDFLLGGTGRDGILGDDGLILTSRNVAELGEPLHRVAPLDPDEGPLRPNEEVNLNSINAVIETPGQIQRAVINVENELNKSVELFAFRTDEVELEEIGLLDEPYRFNDIIFGGLGQDFIHAGDGDDAVSGAEALPAYYSGAGFAGGFDDVNDFLVLQQTTTNVTDEDDPAFSFVADHPFWYNAALPSFAPFNPGDILRFQDRGNVSEFALYDEFFPRRKIVMDFDTGEVIEAIGDFVETPIDFLLNFDQTEGPDGFAFDGDDAPLPTDGDDRMFGDLGNDWIVGGTGRDHMWGGRGDDLLNMDDDHDSGQGGTHPHLPPPDALDNTASDEFQAYADITYGGAGRDVLILNTGADRAIDWVGEYNSYLVPFSPFGAFHISRTVQPQLPEFLYALSDSDGADVFASIGDPALIPAVPDAQLYVDQKSADVRTDDPDPLRNFEPFGEIGLVLQQDRDWQEQTGAPMDPQPGNLQGQREIMRRELFLDENGGPGGGGGGGPNAISFSADVGTWAVEDGAYTVEPTVKGEEAVSIHHLDQTIPSYVEILVTASSEKGKAGYNSNAYIIFDYQDFDNFKFAGIDQGLDKIRIGHRTPDGWVVDTQSNMILKHDTEYDLTLVLHGTVATIYVNGASATSFSFEDPLNDGLLGLGTDNAKATFDDWQVQKLPPVITLTLDDNFENASGYVGRAGDWALQGGAFVGTPGAADYAVATRDVAIQVFARLWIEAELKADGLGGVVFDYDDVDDFKFVALDVVNDRVVIGHVAKSGLVIDNAADLDLDAGITYDIGVSLHGGSVSVDVDGATVLGHSYASILNDGAVGLIADDGTATFESATIKTDDPAYAEPEALHAATPAPNAVGIDQALTPADLAPIVDAAKQRWLDSGSIAEDALNAINLESFAIANLAGLRLAQLQSDGTILVDPTAAGHGWFIDATPLDDAEFTRGAAVAGDRIDLLTVVMHEIGHALNHGHEDGAGALMSQSLDAGVRHAPASDEGAQSSVAGPVGGAEAVEGPRSPHAGRFELLTFEPTTRLLEPKEDDPLVEDDDDEYVDLLEDGLAVGRLRFEDSSNDDAAAEDDEPETEIALLRSPLGRPLASSI